MTLAQLTELFRLMTIINIGILLLSIILILALQKLIGRWHGNLFNLRQDQIAAITYGYLGGYKLLIIVFNLVPYLALVLMQ